MKTRLHRSLILSLSFPAQILFPETLLPLSLLLNRINFVSTTDCAHAIRIAEYILRRSNVSLTIMPKVSDSLSIFSSSTHAVYQDRGHGGFRAAIRTTTIKWGSYIFQQPLRSSVGSIAAAGARGIIEIFAVRDLILALGMEIDLPIPLHCCSRGYLLQAARIQCPKWRPSPHALIEDHINSGAIILSRYCPPEITLSFLTHFLSVEHLREEQELLRRLHSPQDFPLSTAPASSDDEDV